MHKLNFEFMSQTLISPAAHDHASSRLFSGRNKDRTRERGGNRDYNIVPEHFSFGIISARLREGLKICLFQNTRVTILKVRLRLFYIK